MVNLIGRLAAGWCHTRCKVDSIVRDGSHAVIRMAEPQFMLARQKERLHADLPNYIENALELLDLPGEWYLDRSDKTLYYKPRPGEEMDKAEVIVPVLEKLVELRGQLDAQQLEGPVSVAVHAERRVRHSVPTRDYQVRCLEVQDLLPGSVSTSEPPRHAS